MEKILLSVIVVFALCSCSSGSSTGANDANSESGDMSDQSVRYRLTFTSTWSAATHPESFPGNPHFSGLVGAVHNEQVVFWESGQIATDGVEIMAESGAKTGMIAEVNAAIADGYAISLLDGGGISSSPGTVSLEFTVNRNYPQLTLVSMLAPSPDWFVGVHNLSLLDSDDQFVSTLTQPLPLYDSGTDSGLSYQSSNSDTNPPEPIGLLTDPSGNLQFSEGKPEVGRFTIEKL